MTLVMLLVLSHIVLINAISDQLVIRKVQEVAVQDNNDNTILLQYHTSIEVNSVIKQTKNFTKEDAKSNLWKLITQDGFLATDSGDEQNEVHDELEKRVRRKRQVEQPFSTTELPIYTSTRRSANNGSLILDTIRKGAKKVETFVKKVGKQIADTFKEVFGKDSKSQGSK